MIVFNTSMPPKFGKNLIWTFAEGERVQALIGFSDYLHRIDFRLRNRICDEVLKRTNFISKRWEDESDGVVLESKVHIFRQRDEKEIEQIYTEDPKTFFDNLFKTNSQEAYSKNRTHLHQWSKFELETNKEHPCLFIESSLHNKPEALEKFILEMADAERVPLAPGQKRTSPAEILFSDQTFTD